MEYSLTQKHRHWFTSKILMCYKRKPEEVVRGIFKSARGNIRRNTVTLWRDRHLWRESGQLSKMSVNRKVYGYPIMKE